MRSVIDLVDSIISASVQGKLSWTKRDGLFQADLPGGYVITVSEWTDQLSGLPGITVRLRKGDQEIDAAMADEVQSDYLPLRGLFDTARRSANHVEAAIAEVAKGLKALQKA